MGSNNGGGRKPDFPIKGEDRHMTLAEIAEILGTSRERVRQIEQRALMKLRRRLRAKGIKPEDLFGDFIETPAKASHIRPE